MSDTGHSSSQRESQDTWVSAENLSLYPDPVRAMELLKSPETIERDIRHVFVD